MKKIITLLAVVGMFSLQSCTTTTDVNPIDNDTISTVFEVTTSFNTTNNFSKLTTFATPIYSSDIVLVYHLYDVVNGNDVWRLMPQDYYIAGSGDLYYNFDFTKFDVNIFLDATFPLNTLSAVWTQNQTFRIVIVPASFATSVNTSNYSSVMAALKINESQIQKVNF